MTTTATRPLDVGPVQVPPGLRCASCDEEFAGALARRTPTGFVHCNGCQICRVTDCRRRAPGNRRRGWCEAHYKRYLRYGSPLAGEPVRPVPEPLHIEDVEWMVETGEGLTGAAKRTGRSVDAFERALLRAKRPDLVAKLRSREHNRWSAA